MVVKKIFSQKLQIGTIMNIYSCKKYPHMLSLG